MSGGDSLFKIYPLKNFTLDYFITYPRKLIKIYIKINKNSVNVLLAFRYFPCYPNTIFYIIANILAWMGFLPIFFYPLI